MASSGNFFTMNTLVKNTSNVTNGNRKLDMTTNNRGAFGDFEIPKTGKWYFECLAQMGSAVEGYVGIADIETDVTSSRGGITDSSFEGFGFSQYTGSNYFSIKVDSGTADNSGRISEGTTNNAVLGIAVNRDDNELKLYTNNSLKFTLSISADTTYFPIFGVGGANNSSYYMYLNSGVDSTFGGNKTAGGNTDGNGFGDFFYSPPSNHLALCSANLPTSSNIDPAETDDDIPSKNFNVVTYTGNGSTNAITGLGFKPDLVWVKRRNSSGDQRLVDSTRGVGVALRSNVGTGVDVSESNGVTAFGTDGFTLGSEGGYNASSDTFIGWCWRANGGTTTSFSDNINGNYQANVAGGFSIISYTGTGSTGYVTHGLGATPNFILSKDRNVSYGYNVYLKSDGTVHSGYDSQLYLDSANDLATNQQVNVVPDSTKITMAGNEQINKSTNTYIMYAWADVAGYQRFGIYEGNGDADGPFVYTGFKPRMLFVKDLDRDENWVTFDTARDTVNTLERGLFWNAASAESTGSGSGFDIDALANGFKLRCSHDNLNGSSTYIFGAWADIPFKYNNTHP